MMPNHCDNTLSVVGPPDEVARFVAAARGKTPPTGDPPGHYGHTPALAITDAL